MNVAAITVNFKTPDLIHACRSSFVERYPDVPHVLIDNGGCERSLNMLRDIKDADKQVTLIENRGNIGHGQALNQGLCLLWAWEERPTHVLLLDSDTETQGGGFIEKMLAKFEDDSKLFAVGWLRWVNERGLAARDADVKRAAYPERQWMPYVHPSVCLLDLVKYQTLEPFSSSGAPALPVMHSARAQGYTVADFPVFDYVFHKGAGTRALFGGQIRPKTGAQPGQWKKMPI